MAKEKAGCAMCATSKEEGCCKDLGILKGGGVKVKRSTLLWMVIAVLFVAVLYMTFKAGNSSAAVTAADSARSAVQAAAQSAAPSMVGGC